ncbi:hypothetical protein BT96DRAFT_1072542 [Gymnopus androsaceus JB14]|uniref:Uncharacterized protein n=1 Tax=Gymnopus androsaceus JB14 TaxID=1447944 RepID=A0A6A4GUG7_9AGAR|nr:hypothetical protein BT96DRAFT_1072542 [Gymnopus androsaceus JB14]
MESFDLLTLLSKVFQYDYLSLYKLSNQTLIEVFISENIEKHNCVAQRDLESLIYEVMEGRGYPSSILNAIRSASIVYVSHLDAGQPAPGSFNDRRQLERKEACIQHAAAEVQALEIAKQKWPQPIPYSTIMKWRDGLDLAVSSTRVCKVVYDNYSLRFVPTFHGYALQPMLCIVIVPDIGAVGDCHYSGAKDWEEEARQKKKALIRRELDAYASSHSMFMSVGYNALEGQVMIYLLMHKFKDEACSYI